MWSQLSGIKFPPGYCAWCVFLACVTSRIGASSAQQTVTINSLSPRFKNESFYTETAERLSATNKIDLIRYYLTPRSADEGVALVIDTADTLYENIERLWSLVITGGQIDPDVSLFVYNDTDCRFIGGNITASEVLGHILASTVSSSDAGAIFRCVNEVLKMVHSDSSIMLLTGRKPGDGTDLGQSIAIEMTKKRNEFNVIWCADEPGTLDEISDYVKIAKKSNGHFLQFTKIDHDEIMAAGMGPHHVYKTENYTKSSDFGLEVERILPLIEISKDTVASRLTGYPINKNQGEDETADMLYDPKISGSFDPGENSPENYPRISSRILTSGGGGNGREALELEGMEVLASVTAIESATRLDYTEVEITAASNLVGQVGSVNRLTFRVTNNYPLTIRHYFTARSTSLNVVYLEPRNAWIESGQSITVVADVLVPTTTALSTTATVALVIQGIGSVEKSAYVYVRATGSTITDTAKPAIDYSFNSNCVGKLGSGTCSNNLWSVDVTIRDSDSGLQLVSSSPTGIRAATTFVSGTKSSTKFQYAATCCQTTVVVAAYDLLGNSNSQTIDVTVWYNLSMGEILAIVLGTLLLLLILIFIILVIIICIRKRKESQDLPYTQRYGSRPPAARVVAERTSF